MNQSIRFLLWALLLSAGDNITGGLAHPTLLLGAEESAPARTESPARDTVLMCEVREGRGVPTDSATGTGGRGVGAHAYPRLTPPFPDQETWFAQREPIIFHGLRWVMYGSQIPALPDRVARIDNYRGIPVYAFTETAGNRNPEIILLPVAPGCEFQPYYYFNDTGEVRGE